MTRICLLSDGYPPWERGGAQKIAAQLAEGYARRGREVAVVTTVPDRSETGESVVSDAGVGVRRLWTPRWRRALPYLTVSNPLAARGVADFLDGFDPDAIHVHNAHYLSNAAVAAAGECDAPVVKTYHDAGTFAYGEYTAHVADAPRNLPVAGSAYRADPVRQAREQGLRYFPLRNRHNRRTLRRHVDVGVAVSDALRRALTANGMPCHRTVHNGVDAAAFRAVLGAAASEDEAFRDAYGLDDARIVLFGGRTGYTKGGAHLAAAFGRVADRTDDDVRLLVTGDDEFAARMRALAAPHGEKVVTTGWIPRADLRRAFRAAAVVATPSVHLDPFPTVNLEALAAGTPVVTTRFGGASELVDDGATGRVVDPRDVGELADALESFLGDPERADEAGRRGRRLVRDRFTVEGQVEAYLDLFETLEAGPSPRD
ncbi:glycosyltransferase family 4 protein [Halopelagius fulvigenes]|uniref:Glycosyltransferase family 4 protein n=1 Tax=Halopelagius fulvigenes TaxID=1198324 RepID=A0ABD5TY70_9EURY